MAENANLMKLGTTGLTGMDYVRAVAHNKLVDYALMEQRGMKVCPTCDGDPVRYIDGPSWGYFGGQDVEYAECPTCEGTGEVEDEDA